MQIYWDVRLALFSMLGLFGNIHWAVITVVRSTYILSMTRKVKSHFQAKFVQWYAASGVTDVTSGVQRDWDPKVNSCELLTQILEVLQFDYLGITLCVCDCVCVCVRVCVFYNISFMRDKKQ